MGVRLESDASVASCYLVHWAVFQTEIKEKVSWRRMWRMNGGTDLIKKRGLSLRDGKGMLVLAMAMSDKPEVNWPLSTTSSEVDEGDI